MKDQQLSKYLSLLLRHQPERIGLQLDEQGWTSVTELLEKLWRDGKRIHIEQLDRVVKTNNKKRFSFNADRTRIRANQGHSIKIDLAYEPADPPAILYHGTATRFLESIQAQGLLKRNRHHVHLSADQETARAVGQRHGKPCILSIDTAAMLAEGHQFFCSANGVWLCEQVPPQFLSYPL
ncbi:MAG: RNA 2'-phosphotransferase [Bacteroidota bacterium]